MHRFLVTIEVMADNEEEAKQIAAKLIATFPNNATVETLISAEYIEKMNTGDKS